MNVEKIIDWYQHPEQKRKNFSKNKNNFREIVQRKQKNIMYPDLI